jgi:hypothetical protein
MTTAKCRSSNRRGEGPSYRAAILVVSGEASLEDAAEREHVTVASVIRALRYGGRRTS